MSTDFVYQGIMGAALLTGYLVSRRSQRNLSLSVVERVGILFGALCGAMIGAKLPFVLSDWQGFLSGVAWFQDGKTILCGLAGGYLGVEVAKWCLDIRQRTGDTFAVPVAASVAVGRIGCFHAQCCYGTPTSAPWGVVFDKIDEIPRHPTQIYESFFHLAMAFVLAWMARKQMATGQLIKLYIIVYALYRFGTETIRPEARLVGGLTGYQWASLVLIAFFSWLWYRDAKSLAIGRRGDVGSPKSAMPSESAVEASQS